MVEITGSDDPCISHGGSGADQFFITPTAGTLTIRDFNPDDEVPGLTNSSQMTGSVFTQIGGKPTANLESFRVSEHVVLAGYAAGLSQSQLI
jgi:hypothetical protein